MWLRDHNNILVLIQRNQFICDKEYYKTICKIKTNKCFPKSNKQEEKKIQIINNDITINT